MPVDECPSCARGACPFIPSCARGPPCVCFFLLHMYNKSVLQYCTYIKKRRPPTNHQIPFKIKDSITKFVCAHDTDCAIVHVYMWKGIVHLLEAPQGIRDLIRKQFKIHDIWCLVVQVFDTTPPNYIRYVWYMAWQQPAAIRATVRAIYYEALPR